MTDLNNLYIPPSPALRVVKEDGRAMLPTKAHMGDLGYDLYALEDTNIIPGEVTKVRTGIKCGFPPGYGALIRDRSSVATKQGVFVVAGVIDQGYTGEVLVAFYNPGEPWVDYDLSEFVTDVRYTNNGFVRFKAGDKIAQMILVPVVTYPVEEVTQLEHTSRNAQGFGSSGQ